MLDSNEEVLCVMTTSSIENQPPGPARIDLVRSRTLEHKESELLKSREDSGATLACVRVPHGSELYSKVIDLRRDLLRTPLGLVFTEEEIAAEVACLHYAIVVLRTGENLDQIPKEDLLGVCKLTLNDPQGRSLQIKQVAVSPTAQGYGIGSTLMLTLEGLRSDPELRTTRLFCHARDHAVPFYEKLGYTRETEKPFLEVTIPHHRMGKLI
eukprot:Clim_evm112s109 gene=Clim_evmTU112s109